jgi:hypothetical protein
LIDDEFLHLSKIYHKKSILRRNFVFVCFRLFSCWHHHKNNISFFTLPLSLSLSFTKVCCAKMKRSREQEKWNPSCQVRNNTIWLWAENFHFHYSCATREKRLREIKYPFKYHTNAKLILMEIVEWKKGKRFILWCNDFTFCYRSQEKIDFSSYLTCLLALYTCTSHNMLFSLKASCSICHRNAFTVFSFEFPKKGTQTKAFVFVSVFCLRRKFKEWKQFRFIGFHCVSITFMHENWNDIYNFLRVSVSLIEVK